MEINLDTLKSLIKKKHLLSKYHLKRIGIFGSFIRGERANDIDILIEESTNCSRFLDLRKDLEEITHKKIDLVIEKYANPIILYRAKKELVYVQEY